MPIAESLRWLEQTGVAVQIREYVWGQPILIAIHMIGLTGSVGTLIWFDLRLLGIGIQRCSVSQLYRMLKPWMLTSFVAMFISGGMMFTAYATLAYENVFFRFKMAALFVAGVNALVYHLVTKRGIANWDDAALLPLPAQMAGLVSILAWIVVILSGRMMAYTMYGIAT
jgi:hypothetical protein